MNANEAKIIGGKLAVKFALIGGGIASLLMSLLHLSKGLDHALDWVFDFSPTLIFGLLGLILGGYIFGRFAGKRIQLKNNPDLIGIITAQVVVWFAVLSASVFMVLTEWNKGVFELTQLFEFYVFRPIYWINIIGFAPAMIIGIRFGRMLEKRM